MKERKMPDLSSNDTPLGITLPDDMPVIQAAMLQSTIAGAWEDYGGDPMNSEEFWEFLVDGQCRRDHV